MVVAPGLVGAQAGVGVHHGSSGVAVVLEVEASADFLRVAPEGEGEPWGALAPVLGRVVCVGFPHAWSGVPEEAGRCIPPPWGP